MSKELPIVYLARDGETAWSLTGQHTGLTDLPLTGAGERNAHRLAAWLAGLTFAKVYTSPLQRAVRTCELAGFGGVAEVDRDLVEWNYGEYEGPAGARSARRVRTGSSSGTVAQEVSHRSTWRSGHFIRVFAARWIGIELAVHARSFMLSTASLSAVGYENDRSRRVIRLWNDTRHVIEEQQVAA